MMGGMGTGTIDSPATLYGPVSLGLGIVALIAAFFLGIFAILAGSLAITFGVLGLISKFSRTQCLAGLAMGAVGVSYPLSFLFAFTGGF
jgi:hypothetical protein